MSRCRGPVRADNKRLACQTVYTSNRIRLREIFPCITLICDISSVKMDKIGGMDLCGPGLLHYSSASASSAPKFNRLLLQRVDGLSTLATSRRIQRS